MAKKKNNQDDITQAAPIESSAPRKSAKEEMVVDLISKSDKIKLQNILFGTKERKLMVSNKFLNDMVLKYISKRMKAVNSAYNVITTTQIPNHYFTAFDETLKNLDELITIEEYYPFKSPTPSTYKKSLTEQKEQFTTAMINRAWKTVTSRYPIPMDISTVDPTPYDEILNQILNHKEYLSPRDTELINGFYSSIHPAETENESDT